MGAYASEGPEDRADRSLKESAHRFGAVRSGCKSCWQRADGSQTRPTWRLAPPSITPPGRVQTREQTKAHVHTEGRLERPQAEAPGQSHRKHPGHCDAELAAEQRLDASLAGYPAGPTDRLTPPRQPPPPPPPRPFCLRKLVPLGSALSPLRWRGKLRRSWVEGVYKHKPRLLWPPPPPPPLCAMHPYRRCSQRSPALSCSTASDLAQPALSPRLGS